MSDDRDGRDSAEAPPDNVIQLPRLDRLPGFAGAAETEAPSPPAPGTVREDGRLAPPMPHLVEGAVEALLFAAETPMKVGQLDEWLGGPGNDVIREALHAIRDRLRRGPGGVQLVEIAKGWQLRTDPRFGPWVSAMRGGRPIRLSRAALDTLAIVAYRQPCTRSEVEKLRGVDAGGVLAMLRDRGLVQVTGRANTPGRPMLYATTPAFLELFGLRDLSDLPTLRDLRELRRDDPRLGPGDLPEDDELIERDDAPAGEEPRPAQAPLIPPDLLPPDPGTPEDA